MTDARPLALQTKSPLKSPLTAVILTGGGENYKEARLSSGDAGCSDASGGDGGGTGILKQFFFFFFTPGSQQNLHLKNLRECLKCIYWSYFKCMQVLYTQ